MAIIGKRSLCELCALLYKLRFLALRFAPCQHQVFHTGVKIDDLVLVVPLHEVVVVGEGLPPPAERQRRHPLAHAHRPQPHIAHHRPGAVGQPGRLESPVADGRAQTRLAHAVGHAAIDVVAQAEAQLAGGQVDGIVDDLLAVHAARVVHHLPGQ